MMGNRNGAGAGWRPLLQIALAVGLLLAAAGSVRANDDDDGDGRDPRFKVLRTRDQVARRLGRPNLVVLQIHSADGQFEKGHIRGAREILRSQIQTVRGGIGGQLPPLDDLVEMVRGAGIDDDSQIIVASGNGLDSQGRPRMSLRMSPKSNSVPRKVSAAKRGSST